MKRLAAFAEGLTETAFLRRLIEEIAGRHHVTFEVREQVGGRLNVLQSPAVGEATKYFVLLVNCNNDERVKSEILAQRPSLIRVGYDLVIGLRDLYPTPFADLAKVEAGLPYGIPTKDLRIEIFLAVAEVEAWFIQEHSHFASIHPELLPAHILAITGFDVLNQCADTIAEPAMFLHTVYSSRGLAYRKTGAHIARTVATLDIANMYVNCPGRLPHLKRLIDTLDDFFA